LRSPFLLARVVRALCDRRWEAVREGSAPDLVLGEQRPLRLGNIASGGGPRANEFRRAAFALPSSSRSRLETMVRYVRS